MLGYLPEAKAAAEKFAAFLKSEGVKTLVVSNPAAFDALTHDRSHRKAVSATEAAQEIALRSRGTPRIANSLLRRVRDFAQVMGDGHIDLKIARYALDKLNIDKRGLDAIDNKILRTIITTFKGGPVGANTLATAIGEDQGTFEEVYEPFLIKEGFIVRTQRGRVATELSYKHMGLDPYDSNAAGSLF